MTATSQLLAKINKNPASVAQMDWREETDWFKKERIRLLIEGIIDDGVCKGVGNFIIYAWYDACEGDTSDWQNGRKGRGLKDQVDFDTWEWRFYPERELCSCGATSGAIEDFIAEKQKIRKEKIQLKRGLEQWYSNPGKEIEKLKNNIWLTSDEIADMEAYEEFLKTREEYDEFLNLKAQEAQEEYDDFLKAQEKALTDYKNENARLKEENIKLGNENAALKEENARLEKRLEDMEKEAQKVRDRVKKKSEESCFRFESDFVKEAVKGIVNEFYKGLHTEMAMIEVTLHDHGQLRKRNSHTAFVKELVKWGILPSETKVDKIKNGMAAKLRDPFPTNGYKQWSDLYEKERTLCTQIGNTLPESMRYNR